MKLPRGGQTIEKVRKIFDVLSGQPLSLSTLAKQTNMHYYTTQQYIEMIIEIQNLPRLEKIATNGTTIVRLREE